MSSRLKRVTDLFVEGTTVFFGRDETGTPVTAWVNKLNPFEVEEARRDASARRGLRIIDLDKPDNPERQAMGAEMGMWDSDRLAQEYVDLSAEELQVEIYDELEADEEAAEAMETSRRMTSILEDQGIASDDPRRATLDEANSLWMTRLGKIRDRVFREALADAKEVDRETLEKAYLTKWTQRVTMQEFLDERRITELWFATRDCVASDRGPTEKDRWDHTACDHSVRLCDDRTEIRVLPEQVIMKLVEAFEGIKVGLKEAGNSDAPTSSADSSEPPSTEAEESTPSTPEGTPPAPTTS